MSRKAASEKFHRWLDDSHHDFGTDVIPAMLEGEARVYGYRFDGYWQDVGTIHSYWECNMALLEDRPQLDLYDKEWLIHTRSEERAPAKIGTTAQVHRSLISHGCQIEGMVVNSVLSPGVVVGVVSEVARRSPNLGALIASLPLVSLLGIVWLWHDTGDAQRIATHAESTFWYVLPTLPMFLILPVMLRGGFGVWISLAACCALTIALYLMMVVALARFGIRL
jgi:NDP-sugar pyrophosphorylase family protein